MIVFEKLKLKNSMLFGDATFEFKPGISAIYGLNRSGTKSKTNGNGAGKSSFFSQLGEIIFETPIIGERQDQVKDGTRALRFKVGDKSVTVVRNNSKLKISVNGKEKKFRTKPSARAWLAKAVPLTEEEFNTYVHLDARIPHPLVMGSSTERKRFFNSFFGIDKMDVERKLFKAELDALSKVRAVYNEVQTEYETSAKGLDDKEQAELLKAAHKLGDQLSELTEKNHRLQNIQQLLAFEASAKSYLDLCGPIDVSMFGDKVTEVKARINKTKDQLEAAQEWSAYQKEIRAYDKAWTALTSDAQKLVTKLGAKEARSKCRSSHTKYLEVRHELKRLEVRQDELETFTRDGAPKQLSIPDDVNRKQVRADLEAATHRYEHARRFKSGTCDTCGQEVKIKDPKKLKAQIEKYRSLLDQIDEAEEAAEALDKYKAAAKELKVCDSQIKDLRDEAAKLKRYADIADVVSDLPAKPKEREAVKVDVPKLEAQLETDRELLAALRFLESNLDTLEGLQKLTSKQRLAATKAPELQSRINDLHEDLSKVRTKLELHKVAADNKERLEARVKELKAQLVNEKPLKLLVEAYSDKAMKRLAVKSISSRLIQVVNQYARLVFPEDYQFEFRWETSQLQFLVHRRYGKKIKTSDVRKLSGAESKLFTIILVLALLTFVPKRKRTNVLVLDEPTANMSHETTASFKLLLPVLQKLIPTIIIITPKVDERYEGASEFTVIKDKGVARIEKGHPSEF